MHSIRTKIILLTLCAIVVAMTIATLLGVLAVKNTGSSSSEDILRLLCETGEKNLDSYFESVEKAVRIVSGFVEDDLNGLSDEDQLKDHLERIRTVFERTVFSTEGVLTYYYRIDPSVSDTLKGFWYIYTPETGFQEHEVTDISSYDLSDTSALVWFTVPRATGRPVWQPPYVTETLGARVISYNVPVYWMDRFIGVIGIEIDFSVLTEQVDHIRLYGHGYAFINDAEGNLIYHPYMDETANPPASDGLRGGGKLIRYQYEGVEKLAVCMPLHNGMRLNVTVPVSEINGNWQQLIRTMVAVSVIVLAVFILLTYRLTGRITKPLQKLTEAARQLDAGNYNIALNGGGNDEVGVLTRTVSHLVEHLKKYISGLNDLAYADALTAVRNRGAFDIYVRSMEKELLEAKGQKEFAICMMDCNGLKEINDLSGHEKGDLYLKAACSLVCHIFVHSPVFRIGGDEFAVILQKSDYEHRDELMTRFDEACAESRSREADVWNQVNVARGVATYDPAIDGTVNDVVRRADQLMYENKWQMKNGG